MVQKYVSTRFLARLLVVQSIYAMKTNHYIAKKENHIEALAKLDVFLEDEETSNKLDKKFAKTLLYNYKENKKIFEKAIKLVFSEFSEHKKIEFLLASILSAYCSELLKFPKHSLPMLVKEYLMITDSYYGGNESKLMHKLMDSLARKLRTA